MNSMQGNNLTEDYILVGKDLSGMWLQPGFVEGIIADRKSFSSLQEAYKHIFRRNLEYAILLWNGLPVRLSYDDDLPLMINEWIFMLDMVSSANKNKTVTCVFNTPNIVVNWHIEIESEFICIDAHWEKISGNYQAALNQLAMIRMCRHEFLCEWKLLLQQFVKAMNDSKVKLISESARKNFQTLCDIERNIVKRGRFYQY